MLFDDCAGEHVVSLLWTKEYCQLFVVHWKKRQRQIYRSTNPTLSRYPWRFGLSSWMMLYAAAFWQREMSTYFCLFEIISRLTDHLYSLCQSFGAAIDVALLECLESMLQSRTLPFTSHRTAQSRHPDSASLSTSSHSQSSSPHPYPR